MYTRRKETVPLLLCLKEFRRIFSRFEKIDAMFAAFVRLALASRDASVVLNAL
jgi:hypothetical protein